MDEPLVVTRRLTIPPGELGWQFSRSSGPGGQSVNTADSRVTLSWDPARAPSVAALPPGLAARLRERLAPRLSGGVLVVTAQEHRSQYDNRRAARDRLVQLVAAALAPPPPPRRASRPSRGAVQARLDAKRRQSTRKVERRRPADGD